MKQEQKESELMSKLYELNEIGIALSKERDKHKLLERILLGAKDLTYADAGTLYLLNDQNQLQFEVLHTSSMNFHFSRDKGGNLPFSHLDLYSKEGKANDHLVACHAALHEEAVNIKDVYCTKEFDFSGTKEFDQKSGYHCKSLLAIPMKNHEGDIVGVLQLINAQDPKTKEVCCFSERDMHLVQSLASQAAITISQLELIKNLQDTFLGFVRAIGEAIDEKSTHTGKHCQRVPIITMLIAHAANAEKEGPYKDFLLNEEKLYELEMAALLHDCGKIATPIHIIDKSKKLETVFDRIELIKTRFTALKAQREIDFLKKFQENQSAPSEKLKILKNEFEDSQRQLDDDLSFLEETNKGNMLTKEEDSQRLSSIASLQWINEKGKKSPLLTEDELNNLKIARGTLNDEEREIINHHVTTTIEMLKYLPLPKGLRNVTEIAGAHHEHINGKGYPMGITGDKMSPQAKMLAIADVFEALTAPDRPYKKPLALSIVLKILKSMVEEGHLDKDLTEVFLKNKVYLDYGKEHLAKEQLDL